MNPSPQACRFGRYVLDPLNGQLRAGHQEIKLRPHSFDVLLYLVRHPGRLVNKDELLAAVWPGVVVTDNSLAQCMGEIRQALQDDAHEIIRNIPRRGYIFTPVVVCDAEVQGMPTQVVSATEPVATPVTSSSPEPNGPASPELSKERTTQWRSRVFWMSAAALLLLLGGAGIVWFAGTARGPDSGRTISGPADARGAVAPRLSIVVLPLANVSGSSEQDYFADGLTDDLTGDLSRIPDGFVIARSTAFSYKGKTSDVRKIGQDLGVRYVLEGSVRQLDNELRVNVHLVDAQTGTQLWADRFDGDSRDLPALQRQITGRIAQAVHFELIEVEASRALRERPTNPNVYDLVLRGTALLRRQTRESVAEARNLLLQAIALDSQSVAAWAGLAKTYFADLDGGWAKSRTSWLRRATEATEKASAIDPNYGDVGLLRGAVLFLDGRLEEALVAFEKQLALNRNYAPTYLWMARTQIALGRPEEAFRPMQEAIRLSPRDPQLHQFYAALAAANLHLGKDDAAVAWAEKAIALRPDWVDSYPLLIAAATLQGDSQKAQAALTEFRRQLPDYTIAFLRAEELSDRPAYVAQRKRYYDGLRKAGLPE